MKFEDKNKHWTFAATHCAMIYRRLSLDFLEVCSATLRIEGTNVSYKTGDSLAVWPRNPFDKVEVREQREREVI